MPSFVRALPIACLALACGEPAQALAPEAASEVAQEPPDGTAPPTLVVALRRLPDGLDPLGDLDPFGQRIAHDLVFETLVRRGGDEFPFVSPGLSDRCISEPFDRPRTVTCHVPSGLFFHDGSEVDPKDVVYSLEFWLDPRREWLRKRHHLARMHSVEIVDGPSDDRDPGRWVRIGFSSTEPLALEKLAQVAIVPARAHRNRATQFARAPIGSGPMRVTTLAADRIVLEAVADWSRPERAPPGFTRHVYRGVDDGAESLTLLRRGEVQLVPEVAPAHLPVELGKPGMAARFVAYRRTPPVYDLVLYNVDTGVQAGPRLREALHSGVPRERAEREIYGFPGLHLEAPVDLEAPTPIDLAALVDARAGELGRAGLPAPLPATTDPAGIASAVAELERLGWPLERGSRRRAGGQLRVTIMWDPAPGRATALFELLREGWRALGIVVTQATASWSYLSTLMRAGQFDVALVRLAEPSDADLFDHFHSRGETNMAKVRDAVLDQALEDYRSADDRTGRDAAKVRIAERLTALRVSTILHAPVEIMLIDKRVSGVHFLDDLPLLDSLHP